MMANSTNWKALMDDCLTELMASPTARHASTVTNTSTNNTSVTQNIKVTHTSTQAVVQSSLPLGTTSNVPNGTQLVKHASAASDDVDNVSFLADEDDDVFSSIFTDISMDKQTKAAKKKSIWVKILKWSPKSKKSKTSLGTQTWQENQSDLYCDPATLCSKSDTCSDDPPVLPPRPAINRSVASFKPSSKISKRQPSLPAAIPVTSVNPLKHSVNPLPLPPRPLRSVKPKSKPLPKPPNGTALPPNPSPGTKNRNALTQPQPSQAPALTTPDDSSALTTNASASSVDSCLQSEETGTQLPDVPEVSETYNSSTGVGLCSDDDIEQLTSEDEALTEFSKAWGSPTDVVLTQSADSKGSLHIQPSSILQDVFSSDICRDKSGVKCMNKCSCKSLRFNKPYLWVKLLKDPAPDIVSLSDDDNEILEKLYCSPYVDEQSVAVNENCTLHFDFNNMQLINEDGSSVGLFRLSTASATSMDDEQTCTRWVWYHQQKEDTWELLSSADAQSALTLQYEIEARYQAGDDCFTYTSKSNTYLVYFKDMTRTTAIPHPVTNVKRRPYYRSQHSAAFDKKQLNAYLSENSSRTKEGEVDDCYSPRNWRWIDICNKVHYFPRAETMQLEAMYCDPRRTTAALYLGGGTRYWTADFESMTVTSEPGILLRAPGHSGSSDPANASESSDEWIWYWKDDENQWVPYPAEDGSTSNKTSRYIEACRCSSETNIYFECNGNSYKLDTHALTQTNINTGNVRDVRRRPKMHSSSERVVWVWYWKDDQDKWVPYPEWDISERSLTSYGFEQGFQTGERKVTLQGRDDAYVLDYIELFQLNKGTGQVKEIKREKRSTVSPINSLYPSHWKKRENYNTCWQLCVGTSLLSTMSTADVAEMQQVMECFTASLPEATVTLFDCIQNNSLYDDYISKKDKLKRKWGTQAVEERLLFHGTKQTCVDSIIHQGFDFRLAGSSFGTVYGKGTYFARDASFSSRYTGDGTMLVAKVLVGKCTLGKSDIPRPPEHSQGRLYDSCVNDDTKPTIFVIFDIDQAYPAYLIKYK